MSKNLGLFEPFISQNEHLTKTGSGQTQGQLKKGLPFFLREEPWAPAIPSVSREESAQGVKIGGETTVLFVPFSCKHHHFAETASGQT